MDRSIRMTIIIDRFKRPAGTVGSLKTRTREKCHDNPDECCVNRDRSPAESQLPSGFGEAAATQARRAGLSARCTRPWQVTKPDNRHEPRSSFAPPNVQADR